MQYLMTLATLVIALLGMGAAQAAIALAIMFGMHKKIPDKLPEKQYGDFDFDSYDKPAFNRFLTRLAVVFVGPTFILHTLVFLFVGRHIIQYWGTALFILFVFEVASIAALLFYVFRLEVFRLVILTASSAIVYLFFQWLLKYNDLLLPG